MKPNRLFSIFATLALFLTSTGFESLAQQPASQSSKIRRAQQRLPLSTNGRWYVRSSDHC